MPDRPSAQALAGGPPERREKALVDLKVVSERSAADIKKRQASAQLGWALKDLTANLIRVVRGAGKPELIFDHVDGFVKAFRQFCDDTGEAPAPALLRELIVMPEPNLGP
jgi:hypothetical protein